MKEPVDKIYVVCEYCGTVNLLLNSRCSTCEGILSLPDYLKKEHQFLIEMIEQEKQEQIEKEEKEKPFWKQKDYIPKGSEKVLEHYNPDYVSLPLVLYEPKKVNEIRKFHNAHKDGFYISSLFIAVFILVITMWNIVNFLPSYIIDLIEFSASTSEIISEDIIVSQLLAFFPVIICVVLFYGLFYELLERT